MPEGNNVDSTILKLAEQYQSCNVRSRELNEERSTIRANVDKLGIDPSAFTVALAMVRDKTPGERTDYSNSLTRVLSALDGKETDLFGADEMAKRDKRAANREEKKTKAGTPREVQDDKSDKNPKSNPDAGGAGKGRKGKAAAAEAQAAADASQRPPLQPDGTPWPDNAPIMITDPVTGATRPETGDELITRVAREENAKREQREGAALLGNAGKGAVDNGGENLGVDGKPKSQTQLSKEKLEAARLN